MNKIVIFILLNMVGLHLAAQEMKLKITISDIEFTAILDTNETVDAFVKMLPIELDMTEMGGYEKYHNLSWNLPGRANSVGTTYEGDLMIWSSNCLVLFYVTRSTSYSYIRLGRVENTSGLRDALGSGNVLIKFELDKDNSTSVKNVELEKVTYTFFPHPFVNSILVTGDFDQLSLFNLQGVLVAQSKEGIIQTDHLCSGIYFLKIDSTQNGSFNTKKVIKK